MQEIENSSDAFQFMLKGDHEVVVYGVLKSLNIRPFHDNYQDLVQDGRLAFVAAYDKYPHERENQKKMLNYIYQSVRWQILDGLRQTNRISAKNAGWGGG
ncbi:sigma factor [Fructilactobacillus lindneri]|nr:sigma factor [Fructilactobacillus lindneri]POH05717.1 hypothetical protein BGL35_05525 [Fructilactobacillus lindneri]